MQELGAAIIGAIAYQSIASLTTTRIANWWLIGVIFVGGIAWLIQKRP